MRLCLLGGVSLEATGGREVRAILRQPKRLALLLYLTTASPRGFHRRDKLVALFWPELDDARARHALRQALYVLRRALPDEVLVTRGDDEVGVAPDQLWCDVAALELAFREGRFDEVCELFRGDFVDGLHIPEVSPEFEYWLSAERERLRRLALEAAWNLADEAVEAGHGRRAAHWAARALEMAPFDEFSLQRQVRILDRFGDRSGALQAYEQFAARLLSELEAEPSPETQSLVETVRQRSSPNGNGHGVDGLLPPDRGETRDTPSLSSTDHDADHLPGETSDGGEEPASDPRVVEVDDGDLDRTRGDTPSALPASSADGASSHSGTDGPSGLPAPDGQGGARRRWAAGTWQGWAEGSRHWAQESLRLGMAALRANGRVHWRQAEAQPAPPAVAPDPQWWRHPGAPWPRWLLRTRQALRISLTVIVVFLYWVTFSNLFFAAPTIAAVATAAPRVLVLPFRVQGGRDALFLGDGMVSLLSAKLDGAGDLAAVEPRAVLQAAAGWGAGTLSLPTARRIAAGFSAQFYVVGGITAQDGQLQIVAQVYEQGNNTPLSEARVTGDADRLPALLDQLTLRLLVGWKSHLEQPARAPDWVPTNSLPAVKSYLRGEGALGAGDSEAARADFEQAIRDDSTFALAYYGLSVAARRSLDDERADWAVEQALRYRTALPEREEHLVAARAAYLAGAANEAERLYGEITRDYPEDADAWFQYGELYFHLNPLLGRSVFEAERPFRRAVALNPERGEAFYYLAQLAALQGNQAAVDSLGARAVTLTAGYARAVEPAAFYARLVGNGTAWRAVLQQLGDANDQLVANTAQSLAVFGRDLSGAAQVAQLLTRRTRPEAARIRGALMLAELEIAQGRWHTAESELAYVRDHQRTTGIEEMARLSTLPWLPTQLTGLAMLPEQFLPVPGGPPTADSESQPDTVLREYLLGRIALRLDRPAAVSGVLTHLNGPGDAVAHTLARSLRAELAYQAGRPTQALSILTDAGRNGRRPAGPGASRAYRAGDRFLQAELLRESGRDSAALSWYASLGQASLADLVYLAPAHLGQGAIQERLGNADAAGEHYAQVLSLWNNADPELMDLVDEAAAGLQRVNTMPLVTLPPPAKAARSRTPAPVH